MGKSVNSVMYDLLLISSFFMHSPSQPSVQVWSLRSINTTENILDNRHVCAYRCGNKHDKHMSVFWGTDFGKNKKGVGVCVDVMCVCVCVCRLYVNLGSTLNIVPQELSIHLVYSKLVFHWARGGGPLPTYFHHPPHPPPKPTTFSFAPGS